MARLSIIVAAVGSQTDIDTSLVSVLEHRPADCEVILAHPPSYVDPYDLFDEIRFVSSADADLCSLFNAGLKVARGEIVHTIRPGVVASEDWCEPALRQFELNTNTGGVSPLVVSARRSRPVRGVAHHVLLGKCLVTSVGTAVLCPLIGTGFYRASALRFMHGFDPRFREYADVELGFRLKAAGYVMRAIEDSQVHTLTAVRHQRVPGYCGGKLRANLLKRAQTDGQRSCSWWGLLGEPWNNGFGPATVAAMFGHVSVWRTPSTKPLGPPIHSSTEPELPTRCQPTKAA